MIPTHMEALQLGSQLPSSAKYTSFSPEIANTTFLDYFGECKAKRDGHKRKGLFKPT